MYIAANVLATAAAGLALPPQWLGLPGPQFPSPQCTSTFTSTHSWEFQEACLTVLPGEDWELPYRAVPSLDKEPAHPAVLVVPVPDSDSETPVQSVSGVEGPTENPVGGGVEGDWEVKSRWKIRDILADERCSQAACLTSSLLQGWKASAG